MKLKLSYSVLFCFIANIIFSQELVLLDSVQNISGAFRCDRLENIYTYNHDLITRHNSKGDTMFISSNKMLGEVTDVDLTLAMRPLVHYKNSNQIVLYDNTLSKQTETNIKLEQLAWQQVTLVASSFNNNQLWLYDNANFEILQVNKQLSILQRSGNLTQITGIEDLNPSILLERSNKLYLINKATGVLVFDLFGTYVNQLAIKNIDEVDIVGDIMFYIANDHLHLYNLQFHEDKTIPLKMPYDFIDIVGNKVFIQYNNSIFRYEVQ